MSFDSAQDKSSASFREEGGRVYTESRRSAYEREQAHASVLVEEVLELLAPEDGDVTLDATLGAGGHSEALLTRARVKLVALDADPSAVAATARRLAPFGARAKVVEGNFADAPRILASLGIFEVNRALFDLGWRREQLYAGKGFSFEGDEPLDMSYGSKPRSGFTAAEVLNTWSEEALANVFFGYGGERYARRIACLIVESRERVPLQTTAQLVEIVKRAMPARARHGKTHVATKVFQALRIAVNDELRALEEGVRGTWNLLAHGGRIAVISFHSIEDRAVKNLFKSLAAEGGTLVTKKPVTASAAERASNPSARSAKLRVIEKLKTKN